MVKVLIGDIFESKAQTLVTPVDCVGRMGKGIALEFKKRFPDVYKEYLRRNKAKGVKLGEPYLCLRVVPPWVLTFPTRKNSGSTVQLEDVVRGLEHLERHHRAWGITSLAVPTFDYRRRWYRATAPGLLRHRIHRLPDDADPRVCEAAQYPHQWRRRDPGGLRRENGEGHCT